jgi:hypothetical protein
MIRVIDNKPIDLTNDEFNLYNKICDSYKKDRFTGSNIFKDLFETDKNGIIIYLKPASKLASIEAFLFITSVMVHQHLRISVAEFDSLAKESSEKLEELKTIMEENKKLNLLLKERLGLND